MVANAGGINDEIISLWEKWDKIGKLPTKHWPLLYPEVVLEKKKERGILFVGMNPSLAKNIDKLISEAELDGIYNTGERLLKWPVKKVNDLQKKNVIRFEEHARSKYSYYRSIKKLMDLSCPGREYEVIDLFLIRDTDQKGGVGGLISNPDYSDFLKEQIKVWASLVLQINPVLIVVINAEAAHILNYAEEIEKMEEDKKNGLNKYKDLADGYVEKRRFKNEIPIIFSSMLSGGRMDIYSRERLAWHINSALASKGCCFPK
ncbi:MAG: hypothetical protein HQL21_09715 [Candidatus Omnitrophica bacterium]|nr:hypothetical protein [Candidatus Omnitrophota bacterium]